MLLCKLFTFDFSDSTQKPTIRGLFSSHSATTSDLSDAIRIHIFSLLNEAIFRSCFTFTCSFRRNIVGDGEQNFFSKVFHSALQASPSPKTFSTWTQQWLGYKFVNTEIRPSAVLILSFVRVLHQEYDCSSQAQVFRIQSKQGLKKDTCMRNLKKLPIIII